MYQAGSQNCCVCVVEVTAAGGIAQDLAPTVLTADSHGADIHGAGSKYCLTSSMRQPMLKSDLGSIKLELNHQFRNWNYCFFFKVIGIFSV